MTYPPTLAPPEPTKKKAIKYDSERVREKAKALLKECMEDARNDQTRLDRDRQDWLNLLYYRGGVDNQWVVWDKASAAWVPRPTENDDSALPSWVPRACTNLYAKKIDGITSILDQSQPAQEWAPSTEDDEDIATAKVCDAAVPVLLEEIGYDVLRRQIHKHIALIDKVALCVYYSTDKRYGEAQIQALQCPQCGWTGGPLEVQEADDSCPECGAPGDELQPQLDGMGAPVGMAYPKGKMCAELIPSFEFSLPRSARISDETRVPWVLMHTRYSYEEAIKEWPEAKSVIDRTKRSSTSNLLSNTQRQYADAMSKLSSPRSARSSGALSGDITGPVVFRLQHDPIEDKEYTFPEGLYAVMIDDEIIECGPLMVKDDEGRFVKSVIIRTFAQAPGSPYNKPPADDMVPLQYWRNLIESLLALSLLHEAAPRTFIPATVTLEDDITGIPGQQIRFRSHVPGERPFTEPGVGANQSLFEYLAHIDQKFEELSSLNAVLMGNRPHGDPTLGETQILQERGMAAFKTPLDNVVDFERRLSKLLLWTARQSAWAPRFRKVMGETGQWELEAFSAADLGGKVDVMVDPSSAWPKSPLMTSLKLKEAVGMGVIVPQMDPELATKILTKMDLVDLKPSLSDSRNQIARHLAVWKSAHTPQDLAHPYLQPQPWWDMQLHVHLKSQFMNTQAVELLSEQNPPIYQWMAGHVQSLQQMLSQQQMQAAAMQGKGPASKPPEKPEKKGPDGSAVEEAVRSGVLQPADAQPKQDPMQQAIQSGALQPAGMNAPPPGPSLDDLINGGALSPSIGPQE